MKGIFQYVRLMAAGAVLAGLAACGGGSVTNVSMSGTVTGLTSGQLTLTNGLSTAKLQAGATVFTFPGRITVGSSFGVAVIENPALLSCFITDGASGIAGVDDITYIAVKCAVNNTVGGTVTGLRTSGLELTNGADRLVIPSGATSFAFSIKTIAGTNYGATILTQPTGQTCTIANGSGTMGETSVTSIKVDCK